MSPYLAPLHVHVVHHPDHEDAKGWAPALVRWFNGDPEDYAAQQADLPVFVWTSPEGTRTPPEIVWGTARLNVLVLIAGHAMVANPAWRKWAQAQSEMAGLAVVCCDDCGGNSGNLGAFYAKQQSVRLDLMSGDDRASELLLRVTHALARRMASPGATTRLFISHTKKFADSKGRNDDGRAFAKSLKAFLDSRPSGEVFFDEVQISAAEDFESVFEKQIAASVIVAIHTDRFSSRYWCGWETLTAKLNQRPVLVVDALHDGDAQTLSYLGNAQTLRWDPKDRDSEPRKRRIVSAALLELLRMEHDRARLDAARTTFALPAAHVLPFRPELATLPDEDGLLLHPDPPLPAQERRLIEKHRRGLRVMSLTQALAHGAQKLKGRRVAISISEAPDRGRFGMTGLHLERIWTRLATHLLQTEAELAYGGDLRQGGYTEQLFELVRGAVDSGVRLPDGLVHCYLGWPVSLTLTDQIAAGLPSIIELHRPASAPSVAGVDPERFAPPSTTDPAERLAWTLGMTAMRRAMAAACGARVMVGGQYRAVSPIPGLVEEFLTFADLGKPIYVIGGFGGMTRVIARALLGERPAELTQAFQDEDGKRTAIRQRVDDAARTSEFADLDIDGRKFPALQRVDFEAIVKRLNTMGLAGLDNGLTEAENRRLIDTRDPIEQVGLVLAGLGRKLG